MGLLILSFQRIISGVLFVYVYVCLQFVFIYVYVPHICLVSGEAGRRWRIPWSWRIEPGSSGRKANALLPSSHFSSLNFFSFLINYIYSFISYPDCSFPSFLLFSLLPPPPILSSVSVQKEIGLPWISTNHDISSCRRNKLLLFIKAGQGNPEWGIGSQKPT